MRSRVFAVARAITMVTATALPDWTQAQICLDAANQNCVLEQALEAAQSIKEDATRGQALGKIAANQVAKGKMDQGLKLAKSIGDEFWRDSTLADITEALANAGK